MDPHRRPIEVSMLAVTLLIGVGGCASSPTSVEEAPLPDDRQRELSQTLVGTWTHAATIDRKGRRTRVEGRRATWTFCEDGTLVFTLKVPRTGADRRARGTWRLEGRNLVMKRDGTDTETYYRVDEWDDGRMTWFNYETGNDFLLESVD
ncbi:MAG: hypothetical protein ABEL76_09175 [Bradymonadaceae bacterium]